MEENGNFVLYDGNGRTMWSSDTVDGKKSSAFGSGKIHLDRDCPTEFMRATQLYCQGVCGSSWLDHTKNCQSTDADAFCKLKLCDEDAYAINFKVSNAINK